MRCGKCLFFEYDIDSARESVDRKVCFRYPPNMYANYERPWVHESAYCGEFKDRRMVVPENTQVIE